MTCYGKKNYLNKNMNKIFAPFRWLASQSLISKIAFGILLGVVLAALSPATALPLSFLGALFVGALKAVAPILIFLLVISSIANQDPDNQGNMKPIIVLYFIGTFSAAFIAVALSFLLPVTLDLNTAGVNASAPQGIGEVLSTLLFKVVENPVQALIAGNYIGILAWGIGLGLAFRQASQGTKDSLQDGAQAITQIVYFIVQLAPIGVFGLVAGTVAKAGLIALIDYAQLLSLLVGAMLAMALVVNPVIVYAKIRANPYPLIFKCLRDSGITAFFTRSSAANIPVNMRLCKELDLNEDVYSVSIPLGATMNMSGAAITITVMTMAAVHTLGIQIDIYTALLLSVIAAVSACGSSGVAGGSLLLIPLACGLFNIPNDIALQVVGVGFIIGVLQDSAETALNSSTDVVFTAASCATPTQKFQSLR